MENLDYIKMIFLISQLYLHAKVKGSVLKNLNSEYFMR